jgi:8-oxo-dGTP pyrophosphatase MutT (NUDIX family)
MQAVALLEKYKPDNDYEESCRLRMLQLLKNSRCFFRDCTPAHFTASAWLINKTGDKSLLLHHRKLNLWLQPGGHADGDTDLLAVAIKEAQEESGIEAIVPVYPDIFDLDIHAVGTAGAPDYLEHYDVRFLLQVQSDEALVGNAESLDLKWLGIDDEWPTDRWSVIRMRNKWALDFCL